MEEFDFVFQVRAGGVAEGVAAALVAAGEEFAHRGCVVDGDAEFLADALVPHFGESFGHLDADAVHVEVFGVVAGFAEGVFVEADVRAHGDALEGDDVRAEVRSQK